MYSECIIVHLFIFLYFFAEILFLTEIKKTVEYRIAAERRRELEYRFSPFFSFRLKQTFCEER